MQNLLTGKKRLKGLKVNRNEMKINDVFERVTSKIPEEIQLLSHSLHKGALHGKQIFY